MNIDDFDAIIVDLDSQILAFKGDKIESLSSVLDGRGSKLLLTDFQGSVPYAKAVNAPAKYIAPVVDKELQEEGLVEGPSKIFVHSANVYGPTLTHAFFTAIPAAVYTQYEGMIEQDDDCQLHVSFNAVLYAQLRSLQTKEVVACLFVHGSHVDILVGNEHQVHAATRISVFEGDNQFDLICESIASAMRDIEFETKAVVTHMYVNYSQLESLGSVAEQVSRMLSVDCQDFEYEIYVLNGQRYMSSLKAMVKALSVHDTHENSIGRLQYLSAKVAPVAVVVLSGLTVALLAVAIFWQSESVGVQQKSVAIKSTFEQDQASLKSLQGMRAGLGFEQSLKLAQDMERAQFLPSMQEILSDISYASKPAVLVDHILLEYQKSVLQLQVSGQIKASFSDGLKAYSYLISSMENKGYKLVGKNIGMDMKVNTFVLKLERSFAEK